jgi:prepilin-type N-terminal cleavage/methylation domain-containing protein
MKWSRIMFKTNKQAFTLVELLVVVAIIAVLAALAIPAISSAIMSGNQAKATSSLKQIGVAIQLYAGENYGQLPGPSTVAIFGYARNPVASNDLPHLGQFLAPYLGAPANGKEGFVKVLQNPTLSSKAQTTSNAAQFIRCEMPTTAPDYRIWGFLNGGLTMQASAAADLRPKRLQSLSDATVWNSARRAAIITMADQLSWQGGNVGMSLLPAKGSLRGKRLWLFLDGSVSGPVTNASMWYR